MSRKTQHTLVLILLVIIPILAIIATYLVAQMSTPSSISFPDVAFLEVTGPETKYISSIPVHQIEPPMEGTSDVVDEMGTQIDFPLLETGDHADPRIITRDFHVIPKGFRAVDHTRRRVITTNHELVVLGILDRSKTIPNGIWQNIDACRVDSSGVTYLLDKDKNIVQVLDSANGYLRRHTDLGAHLFGSILEIDSIHLDSLDRLWIVGDHRIYVLDRFGNLARIFERRGAPYARQTPGSSIPPEHTPLGYTILPSTNPLGIGANPEQPIVLDVGEFGLFELSGGSNPQLFYIGQNSNSEVVVFDWNGTERVIIDLAALVPGTNRQFVIGQDGYLYIIDSDNGIILALDPVGNVTATIRVDGLPSTGWTQLLGPGHPLADPEAAVRCTIDFDGRLIVLDTTTSEILMFPLRDTDLSVQE